MSRIASAKGELEHDLALIVTSPSEDRTQRLRSAPSVFSSFRIIARATSMHDRDPQLLASGSETISSPICVLKKNRGIAQNHFH